MSKKNKPKIIETPIGDEILNNNGLITIEELLIIAERHKIDGATHLSIDRFYIEDDEGIERAKFSFRFIKLTNEK